MSLGNDRHGWGVRSFRPFGPVVPPGPGLGRAQPVALGPGLDDVGVEADPVDDGGHQPRVGDYTAPLIWNWHTFVDADQPR